MDPQIYRQMRDIEDRHWWFVGRRSIVKHILLSLTLPSAPRILDLGCGTGGNLQLLSEFGEVTGVEFDEKAVAMARDRHVRRVLQGALPDRMPFSTEQFDLIVLLDVLEHIDDDLASVRTLSRLLAPGGYLVVTVPAFPFLWSQHDVEHHHKRRYTASTLKHAIEQGGLRVEHLTYYNIWLFPVVAAVRLLHRMFPLPDVGHDLSLPNKMINAALLAIFSSERYFLRWARVPFGVSVLSIARKGLS